ncbi:MAG TPA: NucA/NucB deoxyribonuclease domain-containing protein [Candidatus Angelobacter sp.]|jgi:RHS repeat-associated protein|nr:NucA/NucB deoxyribonuclease domain-containing protein [Candidatus Angelobacter sp.]
MSAKFLGFISVTVGIVIKRINSYFITPLNAGLMGKVSEDPFSAFICEWREIGHRLRCRQRHLLDLCQWTGTQLWGRKRLAGLLVLLLGLNSLVVGQSVADAKLWLHLLWLVVALAVGGGTAWLLVRKSCSEGAGVISPLYALLLAVALSFPALAFAQMQPNLENGFKAYGSHDGSNLDSVGLMNGNWMLHWSLFPDIGQRGDHAASYFFSVNSKNWQAVCVPDTSSPTGLNCHWGAGGTGVVLNHSNDLSVNRTINIYDSGNGTVAYQGMGYTVATPDGSIHQMYGVPGTADAQGDLTVYESIDTSGYRILLSGADSNGVLINVILLDRHGNQYQGNFPTAYAACSSSRPERNQPPQPGNVAPIIDDAPIGDRYCPQTAFLYQVTDRNGNQMSYQGPQNPNAGVDTLGRGQPLETGATTTDFSDCVSRLPITHANLYYYPGPNGATQSIKTCYAAFPMQTNFQAKVGNTGVTEAQNYSGNYNTLLKGYVREQLVTVVRPDGNKWTFDYDNYLEVSSVGLPTGGSINLTWTTIALPNCGLTDYTPVSRAVATRTVTDNNGHSSTWTYTWGAPVNGVLINSFNDPMGDDTMHTFTDLGCGFYETRTQSYQGSGTSRQLLQQVDTSYASALFAVQTPGASALGNVVPTSIQTTIYPSGKVSLVTKTYDSWLGTNAPIFGNVISEKVYDWGPGVPGPLLRETDTSYAWQINGSYLAAHMLDLPASVIVKDGNGNRVAETDYTYDESQYLTTANIAIQHVAAHNPARGNLTTVSHWLNPGNSFITNHTNWYDTGEVYQQIDALGNTTTHSYDPFYVGAYSTKTCNALNQCVSGTYDFNTGLLTSFTNANATAQASGNQAGDAAHTTNYVYDLMERMTSATLPADPSGNHPQTSFNYPSLTTVERLHKVTSSLTDDAFTYFDGLGRSIRTKHLLPGGNNALVDTSYDGMDRVATVTNPYFTTSELTYGVTQSHYDGLGRPVQTIRQDGSISSISYSDNCTTSTDEAGKQRRACTDALGRLISVDEPGDSTAGASPVASGGGSAATATVTINGSEQSKQLPITPSGPPPRCQPGQLCDGSGGGSGPSYIFDAGTVVLTIGGSTYRVAYNASDTSTTVAANLANAINGDGSGVATASASGGTISLQSRATGSQVSFALAYSWTWDTADFSSPSFTASGPGTLNGGTDGPAVFGGHAYATLYSYDALGNLVQVTQQGGTSDTSKWRVRRFTYDSRSRLLTANNPESGTITYFYDNNGNLTQKVMPSPNQTGTASHTISYAYDALNRITGKAYSWQNSQNGKLPQGTAVVSYTYDERSNGIGHLTGLTDQAGTATYNYDILGRMANESRTINGVTKAMSYAYNLDGSVATMTYPSGAQIAYTVDSAGRMMSVVDATTDTNPLPDTLAEAPNYVTGATYNAAGALTGSIYGKNNSFSGITNTFVYTNRLQPCRMMASTSGAVSPNCDASWGNVLDLRYDFHQGNGNNGNVYSITNYRDQSRNQTFTYDALNRLISAQNAGTDCNQKLPGGQTEYWGNSYVYDAWGNLNQKQVAKCSAESLSVTVAANNQLQGGTYLYDSAGNMTRDNNGINYVYDAENRISSTSGFTYVYDADGNRVQKINGNTTPTTGTLYWYMSSGIVAESDLLGNLQSEYVFFGGERVARKDFPGNAVSYYFSDHLKTASVITDAVGTPKSESDYYPWGGELQFANADSNHYKFTGKERDSESGLDYFGARYYSNGLGRWISADWSATPVPVPYADLTDPQTLNLYGYVRGLPTTKADVDGHGFWNKVGNALASDGCWCDDQGLKGHRAAVAKQRQELAAKEQWEMVDSPWARQWAKDHGGISPRDALAMGAMAYVGIQAGFGYGPEPNPSVPAAEEEPPVEVTISRSKSPASAQHIDDAQAAGHPKVVTLDRSGTQGAARAAARGRAATSGTATTPSMDRDEYPPKCCAEGGRGASVRSIPSSDNRSAGGQLGNQTRTLPDGTKVRIKTGQ